MTRLTTSALAVALLFAPFCFAQTVEKETALFNGKDLSGWEYVSRDKESKLENVWSVQDGILVCQGKPVGYIRTKEKFTNYHLVVEWRWPEGKRPGNSGVLVRMVGEDKVWPKSIEAQLQNGNAGDFWNIGNFQMKTAPDRTKGRNTKKLKGNEKPLGEWNRYDILCDGGHVVLKVNGEVLNEATDCAEIAGHICLQSEGAEIHFRTVKLVPLKK